MNPRHPLLERHKVELVRPAQSGGRLYSAELARQRDLSGKNKANKKAPSGTSSRSLKSVEADTTGSEASNTSNTQSLASSDNAETESGTNGGSEDSTYDLDADDARRYLSMLSARAKGPSGGVFRPLQSERKQQEEERKKFSIDEYTIRIKFPDSALAIAKFRPDDSVNDLFELVKSLIESQEHPFTLAMDPHNKGLISVLDRRINELLGIHKRAQIYFAWTRDAPESVKHAPILSSTHMDSAQEMNDYVDRLHAANFGDPQAQSRQDSQSSRTAPQNKISREQKAAKLMKIFGAGKKR